jgi:hypothetical protein
VLSHRRRGEQLSQPMVPCVMVGDNTPKRHTRPGGPRFLVTDLTVPFPCPMWRKPYRSLPLPTALLAFATLCHQESP